MIGILNCDIDESPETNGGVLINNLIDESILINLPEGQRVDDFETYSGFIITGSRLSFDDNKVWLRYLRQLLLDLNEQDIPCLAICFGMQVVADMFDGVVKKKVVNENGFKEVYLSEHELFNTFENSLQAYESHFDAVIKTPASASIIAHNDVGTQGFVYENFICIQFHPEINSHVARLMAERDGDNYNELLGIVNEDYSLPTRVFKNFQLIINKE